MKILKEGGLSRIWQHTQNEKTFAIIGSQDKDTKEDRSKELFSLVNKKGLRYYHLKGSYTYEDGSRGEETSLLILNISKDVALSIAQELNQESLIWKDKDFFGMITPENKVVAKFTKEPKNMVFDDVEDFGSRIANKFNHNAGKKFAFKLEQITFAKKGSSIYRLSEGFNELVSEVIFECEG